MKKRLLIIITVIAVIMAASSLIYLHVMQDPNYLIRTKAVSINEDKPKKVSYDYGHMIVLADKRIPVFEFVPKESAEYTFEVTDIKSDNSDMLLMNVVDRSFSDYIAASNISEEDGTFADTITDEASLQKGRRYYILIDAASPYGSRHHSGSFTVKVSKSEEEIVPVEITEDQPVRINIKAREQGSITFRPAETGYYKFDTEIASKNASTGYSVISGVTSEESEDTLVSDGICLLEAGKEYFIQVSIEDIKGSAEVDVRCSRIGSAEFDENGSAVLDSVSMIEYTATESGNILVFSESEGDPEITVYDSKGFPLRSDDDSGEEFGGGSEDFAVVFKAKADSKYHIYVAGKFTECKITLMGYDEGAAEPEDQAEADEAQNDGQEAPEEQ